MLLFAYLILYFLLVFVLRSVLLWKKIGIDEKNKTKLVTKGLFSISRNPIFLGIMIANIGLFIVIPNAFTLLIISLSTISINTQIRLEEEFLKREFGKDYFEYAKKVRRWI